MSLWETIFRTIKPFFNILSLMRREKILRLWFFNNSSISSDLLVTIDTWEQSTALANDLLSYT